MKQFNIGLVVGKFMPLHLGHELVINTAIEHCNQVVILSYSSIESSMIASHRRLWLTTRFPKAIVIVLDSGFPNDDDEEETHRTFCYEICKKLNLLPNAIFGSDNYIEPFCNRMSELSNKKVTSYIVDSIRTKFPISGTMLREKPSLMQEFCSNIVNRPLAKRILLIGGESSGKSTLAHALVKKMPNWGKVDEYGRTFGEMHNNEYPYESMLHIALQQTYEEENMMMYYPNSIVVCDTSPLVTKFYSKKWFGKVDPMLEILSERTYDYAFMLYNDFPYVDDGTRNGVEFALEQAEFYIKNVKQPLVHLNGSVSERVNTVLSHVTSIDTITKLCYA